MLERGTQGEVYILCGDILRALAPAVSAALKSMSARWTLFVYRQNMWRAGSAHADHIFKLSSRRPYLLCPAYKGRLQVMNNCLSLKKRLLFLNSIFIINLIDLVGITFNSFNRAWVFWLQAGRWVLIRLNTDFCTVRVAHAHCRRTRASRKQEKVVPGRIIMFLSKSWNFSVF